MPTFAEYQSEILPPGWLQDDAAGKPFLSAFGGQKDALAARAKEAVKARMPSLAPADAIGLIATERGIDKGATETDADFRERVRLAWDVWRWAGTPYGMLAAFYWAGYRPSSGRVVLQVQLGKQYELRTDYDPSVHTPDDAMVITDLGTVHLGGSPELYQQFAVIFVNPLPAGWSPTPPSDSSAELNAIRALIRKWKPGHATCVSLKAVGGITYGYPATDVFTDYSAQTFAAIGSGINVTYTPPAG